MCKTGPNKVCVSHGSQTTQLEGRAGIARNQTDQSIFSASTKGQCSLAWERTLVLRRMGSVLGRSQVRVRMCVFTLLSLAWLS